MMRVRPKQWKKFSIFRILGNETPPRDAPDARLNVLKFILDTEPEFPNARKCWILNCIHDRERRELICKMLAERNMYYVVVPMWRQKYLEAKTPAEKTTHLIGINRARNLAVSHGQLLSDFTVVLDGDCFFNQTLWDRLVSEITTDQRQNNARKYYSIPSSRATFEHARTSSESMHLAEPMTVFRNDSDLRFDETLPFGQGDKLRFLYQLGHSQESGKHHLVSGDLCKSVSMVHHVTGSDYEIEVDTKLRIELREESIRRLQWQVDHPEEAFPNYEARKHHKPNEYWKQIQGWFDFRGQYSQFAWELPSNCHVVEVGSWLGVSICYLATEFKNRNKPAELYAVDTWQGSDEEVHRQMIDKIGGTDALFEKFKQNMVLGGVNDIVRPIRSSSMEASKLFQDESLDVVFIDASHDYHNVKQDIRHWYPKIKRGGKIAGHDYDPNHPVSKKGVIPAVHDYFLGQNLEIGQAGRTWLHTKM